MAVAIPILMYVSAGVAAYSAIKQGQAASAAAAFNEHIAGQNAEMARSQALAQSVQTQRETVLRIGAARAAAGASGGTGVGSALDVIGDIAKQGELQRQMDIYQGEAQARGYTNTATLEGAKASDSLKAGYDQAGTSLLGGASSAYSTNLKLR